MHRGCCSSAPCVLPPLLLPPAGKLHFVKFETAKVHECIAFIEAKGAGSWNTQGYSSC